MSLVLIHPNDMKAIYGDTISFAACEPPYWMALAAQYCIDRSIDVELIDAEAENLSFEQVATRVASLQPDLVGIFVTGTNLSASTQKMHGTDLTVKTLKQSGLDSKIFLWGLHPSALPQRSLKESNADFIIKGESLQAIVYLTKLAQKSHQLNIDESSDREMGKMGGVNYITESGFVVECAAPTLLATNDMPLPAWQLLPMDRYLPHNWHIMGEGVPESARGRYGVISTSIGCPFHCSFCAIHAQFETRTVRFWDINRVVDEIDRLVNEYNVKYIKILDECFVLNKEYVAKLCDVIASRHYDLNMWGYARIDTVDQEILTKLRRAGVHWLAYGIESGDDETLKGVEKGQYTTDRTRQVLTWTKQADIYTIANFMFGLPDDTIDSMKKTLEFSRELNPEWINYFVTMLYPGSADYYKALKNDRIKDDKWIQYSQYSYECIPAGTKNLSPREVLKFRDYAFNAFFYENNKYFEMIKEKFGDIYVYKIKEQLCRKLKRKLLENYSEI